MGLPVGESDYGVSLKLAGVLWQLTVF